MAGGYLDMAGEESAGGGLLNLGIGIVGGIGGNLKGLLVDLVIHFFFLLFAFGISFCFLWETRGNSHL